MLPPTDQAAVVRLRIFTPTQEIPFAGHPVLGTFYVLAQLGLIAVTDGVTRLMQECNIGLFPVELHAREGQVNLVVMTHRNRSSSGPWAKRKMSTTLPALGVVETPDCRHEVADEVVSTGLPVLIVPVRTLTAVRSIQPNAAASWRSASRVGANGIMAFTTVTVEPSATVHARMFAPLIGILEDPATGSASGALGAYLVQNGVVDVAPTTDIVVEQGYEIERPSQILVRVESDDDIIQEVKVGGQCVMVVKGTLNF